MRTNCARRSKLLGWAVANTGVIAREWDPRRHQVNMELIFSGDRLRRPRGQAGIVPRPPHSSDHRGGEVRVWRASLDLGEAALESLISHLGEDERERVGRFHFRRDAVRFAASRVALRTGLAERLGVDPGALVFQYGPHGKPALAAPFDRSGLSFSASRSEGVGLYAAAWGRRIGVDIERVRPMPDLEEVAALTFSPEERRQLDRLAPAERLTGFFNCWTRKEAYLKAIGTGLTDSPSRFSVSLAPGAPASLDRVDDDPRAPERWTLAALDVDRGYVAAVAVEGFAA
jgi:4'-phosphopantetheinyl transferase